MNDLQIFTSEQFGKVRILEEDGKVLFCGKDVAAALGYDQPHKAVSRHCRYGTKRTVPHPQNPDRFLEMVFIPEGDVYRLIVNSRLPAAQEFERWVFDEVLPSISHKGYFANKEKLAQLREAIDMLHWCQTKLQTARFRFEVASDNTAADLKRYRRSKELRDGYGETVHHYEWLTALYAQDVTDLRDILPARIGGDPDE